MHGFEYFELKYLKQKIYCFMSEIEIFLHVLQVFKIKTSVIINKLLLKFKQKMLHFYRPKNYIPLQYFDT